MSFEPFRKSVYDHLDRCKVERRFYRRVRVQKLRDGTYKMTFLRIKEYDHKLRIPWSDIRVSLKQHLQSLRYLVHVNLHYDPEGDHEVGRLIVHCYAVNLPCGTYTLKSR